MTPLMMHNLATVSAPPPPPSSAASDSGSFVETMREAGMSPLKLFSDEFPRLDLLNHPDELLDALAQLHLVWAGIFITAGLFAVLNGYRWHRTIVMVCTFFTGLGFGYAISQSVDVSLMIGACVGVLAAVLAWPLMKYAIALCGGLAGAFIGANLWTALNQPPDTYYAGALIGLVAFGLLSFILYRVVIIVMVCVIGAFILVMGAITCMIHIESWDTALRQGFVENPTLIPLLVLVTAVIGIVVQQGAMGQKKGGADNKSAAGKPAPA